MASRAHTDGRASALPLSVALSIIPSLPRALLARLVERAIERLDAMDGDPDLEADGDERDGTSADEDPWFEQGAQLFWMDSLRLAGTPDDAEDDDPGEDEGRGFYCLDEIAPAPTPIPPPSSAAPLPTIAC